MKKGKRRSSKWKYSLSFFMLLALLTLAQASKVSASEKNQNAVVASNISFIDGLFGGNQNNDQFQNKFLEQLNNDSKFRQDLFNRLNNDSDYRKQVIDKIRQDGRTASSFLDRFDSDQDFREKILNTFDSNDTLRSQILHKIDNLMSNN